MLTGRIMGAFTFRKTCAWLANFRTDGSGKWVLGFKQSETRRGWNGFHWRQSAPSAWWPGAPFFSEVRGQRSEARGSVLSRATPNTLVTRDS